MKLIWQYLKDVYGLTASVVSGVITWRLGGRVLAASGSASAPAYSFSATTNSGLYYDEGGSNSVIIGLAGSPLVHFNASVGMFSNVVPFLVNQNSHGESYFGFSTGTVPKVTWYSEADDIYAQRRAANAQTWRLYATWTDASNYERVAIVAAAGVMTIVAQTAGTGTDDIDLALTPAGAGLLKFGVHTADGGTPATTGYITIKDAGGTTRKLAVIT